LTGDYHVNSNKNIAFVRIYACINWSGKPGMFCAGISFFPFVCSCIHIRETRAGISAQTKVNCISSATSWPQRKIYSPHQASRAFGAAQGFCPAWLNGLGPYLFGSQVRLHLLAHGSASSIHSSCPCLPGTAHP
jgi:hypothetical protein